MRLNKIIYIEKSSIKHSFATQLKNGDLLIAVFYEY